MDADEKKKRRLLKWHDMPRYLQFNPYILTGYRPVQSVWGCVHSLFYFHNETINILTHGEFTATRSLCIPPKNPCS
jgi:hypothetical protein